ncbi:HNH endonuclease [Saliphagus sp. GCM10025334]
MSNRLSATEWRKVREDILDRDGRECQDCGIGDSDADSLHVHHIRPLDEGGSNEFENLLTLCDSCHFERHAEDRRKGTLEDIRDIFIQVDVPVLRTKEVARRFGDVSSINTPKKLKKLVGDGFLEKGARGVYYRADLEPGSMNLAGSSGVIVDGSYIEDGEYIGNEDRTRQCEDCGRWIYGKDPDRKLRNHKRISCD